MKNKNFSVRLAVVASCLGLLTPWEAVEAAPPAHTLPQVNQKQAPRVTDVCLAEGGRLEGQLLLEDGTVLANAPVALLRRGQVVARSQAGEQGDFTVNHLGGGLYEIAAPGSRRTVRLWAPGTAPPSAKPTLVLKASPLIVRGQYAAGPMVRLIETAKYPLANPLVFGGLVGAAVAIPVVIHNRNKDSGS